MAKKRRGLKIIGAVVAVLLLVTAGALFYMSRGLDDMLSLTVNDINLQVIPDGVYEGSFAGYRWSNTVEVTVQDHQIQQIRVIKPHPFHTEELVDELEARIVESQTLAVDTVTGGTVTSKAFLKAVENALSGE